MLKVKSIIVLFFVIVFISCKNKNTEEVYKVSYDGNGNTEGTVPVDNKEYEEGNLINVMDNVGVLRKSELCFNGWNTKVDGSGSYYKPAESFYPYDENMVLYAQWIDFSQVCTINSGGTITDYKGISKDIIIPNKINGINVLGISMYAFVGGLSSVKLPETLISIDSFAFDYNNFTNIVIPNSVNSVGTNAFAYNKIASLTLPNYIISISDYSFENNLITSIIIPNTVSNIGSGAFDSNSIIDLTIGSNVTIAGTITSSGKNYYAFGIYGETFKSFYDLNGKKGGRYKYENGYWSKI